MDAIGVPLPSVDMIGVPETSRGTWTQLTQGRRFYPMDPQPAEIFIEDIAKSLSKQIRFNGLADKDVNVAHHSVNAAWLAEVKGYSFEVQLAMLMHDAPEYILGDMIRPLKSLFPEFVVIENQLMVVIIRRFNLPVIDHKLIKFFDNLCLAWEHRDMYPSAENWPMLPDVPDCCYTMETWSAEKSEHMFLDMFSSLQYHLHKKRTSDPTYDWSEGSIMS